MPVPKEQRHPSRSIITWSGLTALPWRNGGGVTRQILSRRLDATGAWVSSTDSDWDWRLSIADVDTPGPFSPFEGMTRILTVIEGASITLTVDGSIVELERHRPFSFDGGANTSAEIPHGPIRDLNLIMRTGTMSAEVRIEPLTTDRPLVMVNGTYSVLLEGQASLTETVAHADNTAVLNAKLERFDTVLGDTNVPRTITGEGTIAVITIAVAPPASSPLSPTDHAGLR
ncbi:MAG: HutD family protein [Terrimesophilobacter sp.]